MKEYKLVQRKMFLFTILRFALPIIVLVSCFLVTLFWQNDANLLITLALAVLAVTMFMLFTNKAKKYALWLEDMLFTDSIKGLYDKKKTTNVRGFLNVHELVRNKVIIEPYRRYGYLYYEVLYNKVTIDSSNISLEYLEDSKKKKKKTYYGFVGRAIRYELRSHRPLLLVNKNSKYFSVPDNIVDDDTFLVSGYDKNYERLVKKGSLQKLKEYMQKNNLNISIFYLPEAIYVLIEDGLITINPRSTTKITEEYLNDLKNKFKMPRDLADILDIKK